MADKSFKAKKDFFLKELNNNYFNDGKATHRQRELLQRAEGLKSNAALNKLIKDYPEEMDEVFGSGAVDFLTSKEFDEKAMDIYNKNLDTRYGKNHDRKFMNNGERYGLLGKRGPDNFFKITDSLEERDKINKDLGEALGIKQREGGHRTPTAREILMSSHGPGTLAEQVDPANANYAHDRRLKEELYNMGQKYSLTDDDFRNARKRLGDDNYENGDLDTEYIPDPSELDPEGKGFRLDNDAYEANDRKWSSAWHYTHNNFNIPYDVKLKRIKEALGTNGTIQEKADKINEVAPEVNAHKEGNDIKVANGNTVEDALEQATPVPDTPKEDKTQKQEQQMAQSIPDNSQLPIRFVKPNSDPESQSLGLNFTNEDRLNWNKGEDRKVGDYTLDEWDQRYRPQQPESASAGFDESQRATPKGLLGHALKEYNNKPMTPSDERPIQPLSNDFNTVDDLMGYLDENYPDQPVEQQLENLAEQQPEVAEQNSDIIPETAEEASQVNDGDERTDEANNEEIAKDAQNLYGTGQGMGWNNGYVDDFDPNGPDFDRIEPEEPATEPPVQDNAVPEAPENTAPATEDSVPENPEVFDNGLEDQNQYDESSVDVPEPPKGNNGQPEADDTIVDENAPDVDASEWEQLPTDQKAIGKLNDAIYKKQQEIERQDLIVDQLRSYMEEHPDDFDTARKLEMEELKGEQLYKDKERLEEELKTASTPEVRLKEEPQPAGFIKEVAPDPVELPKFGKSNPVNISAFGGGGSPDLHTDMNMSRSRGFGGSSGPGMSMLGRAMGSGSVHPGYGNVGSRMDNKPHIDTPVSRASKAPIPPQENKITGVKRSGSNNNRPSTNGNMSSGPGMLYAKSRPMQNISSGLPTFEMGHSGSPVGGGNNGQMPVIGQQGKNRGPVSILKLLEQVIQKYAMNNPEVLEKLGIGQKYKHFDYHDIPLDQLDPNTLYSLYEALSKYATD